MAVKSETLESLIKAVRDEVKEASQAFYPDAQIKLWLNDALLKACGFLSRLEAEQIITMINGTANYALPDDFQDTINLRYYDGDQYRFLEFLSPRVYRSQTTLTTTTFPYHYTIIGEEIFIFPTPASDTDTISHLYTANPNELISNNDIPFNGIKRFYPYHTILVNHAVARAMAKKRDFQSAAYYDDMFNRDIVRMVSDLSSKRKGGMRQMRRRDSMNWVSRGPVLPPNFPIS